MKPPNLLNSLVSNNINPPIANGFENLVNHWIISNVLYTFDGKFIYKGRFANTNNIIYTFDGKNVYSGKHENIDNLIIYIDGEKLFKNDSCVKYAERNYIYFGENNSTSDIMYNIDGGEIPLIFFGTII